MPEEAPSLRSIQVRLEEMDRRYSESFRRIDTNITRIFERLDEQAELGHEARIVNLEKVTEGLWPRLIGLATLVAALVTAAFKAGAAWISR